MPYAPAATPSNPRSDPHGAAPGVSVTMADEELARLVDRLVDAIDVREAYEPDGASWDTALRIRRLERELARAWGASRRLIELPSVAEAVR